MTVHRLGLAFFALPAQTRLLVQLQCLQARPAVTISSILIHQRYKTKSAHKVKRSSRPAPPLPSNIKLLDQASPLPAVQPASLVASNNLAESIILRDGQPVVLYEANRRLDRQFVAVSRTVSLVLAGYGFFFLDFALRYPSYTWWIDSVYYILIGGLFTGTVYMWEAGCRHAFRITAVPTTTTPRHVNLHIQGRGMIPFKTAEEIIPLMDLTRDRTFIEMEDEVWEETARVRARPPLHQIPPMIRPFDKFGRWCGEIFRSFKASLKRHNFNYLRQEGKYGFWRVDARGEILHDRRGMDHLIPPRF